MKLIGLTGTIASGKSTVAQLLSKHHDAKIIYTDELAREAVEPGSRAIKEISEQFGNEYILSDGSLNRKKMGDLVFSDSEAKRKLENITHPYISKLLSKKISECGYDDKVIIENAILFESGQYRFLNGFLIVDVHPAIQKTRLMQRNKLTSDEADARIASQMGTLWKMHMAIKSGRPFSIIQNNFNNETDLLNHVNFMWDELLYNL